jgi:hypothetical protein
VPDVRARVNVINRGSEIELLFGHAALELSLAGCSAAVFRRTAPAAGKRAGVEK